PAAVLALMISQAVADAPQGVPPQTVAMVLAAESGVLLLLAASWRLDALAALLSVPVLQGFETGAALSIALSQLPVLVGASAHGSSLPQVLRSWAQADLPWQPLTALYGVGAWLALWLVRRHVASALTRLIDARHALLVV